MSLGNISSGTAPISVLVFTPTPTHPASQGNRKRVSDMCHAMQSVGAELTVLYYATEGLRSDNARQMCDAWDEVDVVFPQGFSPKQSLPRCAAIDDWYDGTIDQTVARLVAERRFDVCVTNYAWYSKIFDSLPANVIRVIDTHDLFGDRAKRFEEINRPPEWFHTSVAQERIGLDRANFVIAIQDVEANTFRQRTSSRVQTIGFLSSPDYLPTKRYATGNRLRVGYIASNNPFNVSSILTLARHVENYAESPDAIEFHVAGPVCSALSELSYPFVCHGIVESVPDFYASIDVAVNPMLGGTGLKIKSLEALGFGKPLVATSDAMVGIVSDHEGHQLSDSKQILRWLHELAENPTRLANEAKLSRSIFRSYRQAQLDAFLQFWSIVEHEADSRRAIPVGARGTGTPL